MAVRKAFHGFPVGEQEVTHLLCIVYSDRAPRKNLSSPTCKDAMQHLRAALWNRQTRLGCQQSMEAAIAAAPANNKQYVRNEWKMTMVDWANYAHCHNSFLLQVLTTDVVESWHSSPKHGVKITMKQWFLHGLVEHIANRAQKWAAHAEKELAD